MFFILNFAARTALRKPCNDGFERRVANDMLESVYLALNLDRLKFSQNFQSESWIMQL
jgi:hypothetical protein